MFFSQTVYGVKATQPRGIHNSGMHVDVAHSSAPLEPIKAEPDDNIDTKPSATALFNPLPFTEQSKRPTSPAATETISNSACISVPPAHSADTEIPAGLRYPVGRYLPPSGPYYEQGSSLQVLGSRTQRKNSRCFSCSESKHGPPNDCLSTCSICSTTDHLGKVGPSYLNDPWVACPMLNLLQICSQLYCSFSWHRLEGNPQNALAIPGFQIRPTLPELEVLSQLGVLQPSIASREPIVPIMTYPICQKFYGNSTEPNVFSKGDLIDEAIVAVDTAVTIASPVDKERARPQSQQHRPTVGVSNTSPDSIHGGHSVGNLHLHPVQRSTEPHSGPRSVSAWEELVQELEARILGLEEEMLGLKTDNVQKDRNIRALERENERLRHVESETQTGSKRPRL